MPVQAQHIFADGRHLSRDRRIQLVHGTVIDVCCTDHALKRLARMKRGRAGQRVIQNRPEPEGIRLRSQGLTACGLRRHVARCPNGVDTLDVLDRACKSEVKHHSAVIHKEIAGLDVAVNEALRMYALDAAGCPGQQLQNDAGITKMYRGIKFLLTTLVVSLLQPFAHRRLFHPVAHDERPLVGAFKKGTRSDNCPVTHQSVHFILVVHPLAVILPSTKVQREGFDCHEISDALVAGLTNTRHLGVDLMSCQRVGSGFAVSGRQERHG